jgi:exodeoxyribonuclease VII large subunit
VPLESSPEQPLPVRTVARAIGDWVGRLGRIWVEGQITQLTVRPGQGTCFIVLRDPAAEMSLQVAVARSLLEAVTPAPTEGARVVVWARPEFRPQRGTLSLTAFDIRPVGIGALLARLEQLRQTLAAEGLFAADRKRPLPFLPSTVGLVTGRASAAERDVVDNARRRWPAVRFRVDNVAVQGPYAVTEVIAALQRLDADPEVDVIVIARGGGSVEDLLPFSDEALVRAVAACVTPVVSAIGHEPDSPLLDLVADVRASTPTDAAKRIVPDVGEELARVRQLRERARWVMESLLDREERGLAAALGRPVLADPRRMVAERETQVVELTGRARRALGHLLDRARSDLEHTRARVVALSPAATLRRGYAVLQRADGAAVREVREVTAGEALRARVADGAFTVTVGGPPEGGHGEERA